MEPGGALAAKVPPTGGETTVGQVARWQPMAFGRIQRPVAGRLGFGSSPEGGCSLRLEILEILEVERVVVSNY